MQGNWIEYGRELERQAQLRRESQAAPETGLLDIARATHLRLRQEAYERCSGLMREALVAVRAAREAGDLALRTELLHQMFIPAAVAYREARDGYLAAVAAHKGER